MLHGHTQCHYGVLIGSLIWQRGLRFWQELFVHLFETCHVIAAKGLVVFQRRVFVKLKRRLRPAPAYLEGNQMNCKCQ